MATKRYLDVRYDVTDLSEAEVDQLALEAGAQAEFSDGHPSVDVEIETNAVDDDLAAGASLTPEARAAVERLLDLPLDREEWPIHQPDAPEAPIPGRHWYSGCNPDRPRVNPATGLCEDCGRPACRVCGRENCPDHHDAARIVRAIERGESLFAAHNAADDTSRANGSDARTEIIAAEVLAAIADRASALVANVLFFDSAFAVQKDLVDAALKRDGVRVTATTLWFDPYLAVYNPADPGEEPLFLMYGDAEGGTFLAPGTTDVGELERRIVRYYGDDGWTIDDHDEVAR